MNSTPGSRAAADFVLRGWVTYQPEVGIFLINGVPCASDTQHDFNDLRDAGLLRVNGDTVEPASDLSDWAQL